jgi:membrane protein implicated in regulation of membrane protease activity
MNPTRRDVCNQTINGVIDSVVRQEHEWRVQVYGVYWTALATQPVRLLPGDRIQVVGRQNQKLIITRK